VGQQQDVACHKACRRTAGVVIQNGRSAKHDVIRDLSRCRTILVDPPRRAIEAAEIEMTADRDEVEKAAEPIEGGRHAEPANETKERIIDQT
jgi:hypothetical protein